MKTANLKLIGILLTYGFAIGSLSGGLIITGNETSGDESKLSAGLPCNFHSGTHKDDLRGKHSVEKSGWNGSGTEQDPYLITNALQLSALRDNVAGSINTYWRLNSNIDLSGFPWVPIDDFSGTLNGDGHTVSGVCLDKQRTGGLFRNLGYSGKIYALHVTGTVYENVSGGLGGIVCNNSGILVACSFCATVKGGSYAGIGITGYNSSGSKIIGCYSSIASVEGDDDDGYGITPMQVDRGNAALQAEGFMAYVWKYEGGKIPILTRVTQPFVRSEKRGRRFSFETCAIVMM